MKPGIGLINRMEKLYEIQRDICKETDLLTILEKILTGAQSLTNADGGTLYRMIDKKFLRFEIMKNDQLGLHLGGTSGNKMTFQDIPLYSLSGRRPNYRNVCCYSALKAETINIEDAYKTLDFDFSGTQDYDKKSGFRSKSFLTIPLVSTEHEVIGVLQLINARNASGKIQAFKEEDVFIVECLATVVAITLSNILIAKNMKELFKSFVNVLAVAIDEKSPHTGGHCHRVPEITRLLAQACDQDKSGPYKDFSLSEEQWYELELASLLHDCGKVTTPVHVMDKATKLETICDRIDQVELRFYCLKLQEKLAYLEQKLTNMGEKDIYDSGLLHKRIAHLDDDFNFLKKSNLGSEFMKDEDVERVKRIAAYQWMNTKGKKDQFLDRNEVENLTIRRGTLTEEERDVINYHIVMTQKMLDQLPLPKGLEGIPIIAGSHHERMDGKGYPNGIKAGELPLQARIMCIADVFEALAAKDRPYKKGKMLSECLEILVKMKNNGHLDPVLVDFFIEEEVYLKYAKKYLDPDQIDRIDKQALLAKRKAA